MPYKLNVFTGNLDLVNTAGTGDVTGPAASTDNAVVRFNGTTGKIVQESSVTIDDSGILTATNISGTNTGNVTLTGETYLSIAGQVITVGVITDSKASLAIKPPVTVVATSNLTLSGAQTVDGQLTVAGTSIVLATAQSTGSQNGPWIVQSGAWTRPTWYPSGGTTQAFQFITTMVRLGTTYQGTTWRQTAAAPITIDTTATTWTVTPFALNSSTLTGIVPVANGGTGLSSGTSGGILGFTASGTIASSGALTANAIVLGGGAGATPTVLGSLGTTTTVLHGNAGGAPTFGAVSLTADVSGILPVANGGSGTSTALTQGSVVFAGASGVYSQDNAGFFYDATNHRLGLNNTAPARMLDLKSGTINFTMTVAPTSAPTSALAGAGAGNLSNGAYTYTVTYTSLAGESQASSASNTTTVVNNATNGQISLTAIPVSPDPLVTGRRIFRTQAGGSTRTLVGTIANNTGTTFTDNVADATIVNANQAPPVSYNSSWGILNDGTTYLFGRGNANTFLGPGAGNLTFDPVLTNNNCAFGRLALSGVTGGAQNMAIGTQALSSLTTGSSNVCVGGAGSGSSVTTGVFNTMIGATCAVSFTGNKIVSIGRASAINLVSGEQSVWIGDLAGTGVTSGAQCIFIGTESTGSATLSKSIAIGYQSNVTANNTMVLGGTTTNSVQVAINATSAVGQFDIVINSSSRVGEIIKGASSQSADLAQWQNSSAAVQAAVSAAGKISTQAGTSAVLAKVGGRLTQSTTQATSASTTETDLHSYTIAANTLATNGDTIIFRGSGTFQASAFTKQVKIKLGGTTIFDSGALGISLATNWVYDGEIIRSSSGNQKCNVNFSTSSGTLSAYASYQATAITDSSSMILKSTGQVGTTGGTDVQEETFSVEFIPAF